MLLSFVHLLRLKNVYDIIMGRVILTRCALNLSHSMQVGVEIATATECNVEIYLVTSTIHSIRFAVSLFQCL